MEPLYFDYVTVAREAGLTEDQIAALVERWRQDYGSDQNLLELRLLRVCNAIKKGACTFEQALAPEPEPGSEFKAA